MPKEPPKPLSFKEQSRLDVICDQFEADWISGLSPDLDSYIQKLDSTIILNGTIELIVLDAHYRSQSTSTAVLDTLAGEDTIANKFKTQVGNERLQIMKWSEYVHKYPYLADVSIPTEFCDVEKVHHLDDERFLIKKIHASGGWDA